jgi:hypothetical protein
MTPTKPPVRVTVTPFGASASGDGGTVVPPRLAVTVGPGSADTVGDPAGVEAVLPALVVGVVVPGEGDEQAVTSARKPTPMVICHRPW